MVDKKPERIRIVLLATITVFKPMTSIIQDLGQINPGFHPSDIKFVPIFVNVDSWATVSYQRTPKDRSSPDEIVLDDTVCV